MSVRNMARKATVSLLNPIASLRWISIPFCRNIDTALEVLPSGSRLRLPDRQEIPPPASVVSPTGYYRAGGQVEAPSGSGRPLPFSLRSSASMALLQTNTRWPGTSQAGLPWVNVIHIHACGSGSFHALNDRIVISIYDCKDTLQVQACRPRSSTGPRLLPISSRKCCAR